MLLLLLSAIRGEAPHEKRIHGDAIWDTSSVVDEGTRAKEFRRRHQEWPDPQWLAREHPGYAQRMAERTAGVMAHRTSQKRWDEWMFLAQARLMLSEAAAAWPCQMGVAWEVPGLDRAHQPWAPCDPHAHRPWAPCDPRAHQPWAPWDPCLAGTGPTTATR